MTNKTEQKKTASIRRKSSASKKRSSKTSAPPKKNINLASASVLDFTDYRGAKKTIQDLSRFPEENPFPVLRLSADGTILYSNGPGCVLLDEWRCKPGQKAPQNWQTLIKKSIGSDSYQVEEITCGDKIFSLIIAPVAEGGYVNLYGRDVTKQRQTEMALEASEQSFRRKLESILSPEGDIGQLELEDIIDVPALQSLMDHFYQLAGIPMAITDMAGKSLVGAGWQDICTKFHRVNSQTCRYCLESDLDLSAGANEGEFKLYKCKNNLWDAATPIIIGGKKMGNLFTGQFFFEDETPDYDLFRRQAKQFGFDETEYMAALDKIPHLSRQTVHQGMEFLYGLSRMISQLSYGNIKLTRMLTERDTLTDSLRRSREDLNRAQEVGSIGSWRLDVRKNELTWSDENYRIFGVPKGTPMTYEGFLSIVHPDDRRYVDARWKAGLSGEDYDIEHRLLVDGQVKWVREKAYLEFDNTGELIGGFGITDDITERKLMEEELRQSRDELEVRIKERTAQLAQTVDSLENEVRQRIAAEKTVQSERKRFEDVLEMMPAYAILLTPDYHVVYTNRTFRDWFGDDNGKKCYEFLFNRTEPCEFCETYTVLKTHKPHFWEWTGPNGRNYDIYDYPFADADDSPLIMEIGVDVTAHKQTQARIHFSNVLLELFTKKASRKEYLDSVVRHIQAWSGCQCVGIRLADGDGWIPYESCVGFSDEFLASENRLSLAGDDCLCIRAITQRAQLSDSLLVTQRGSFCSGNMFAFLDALPDEEKPRYRGTCLRHGFASLAVIPVRYRDEIVGAIHLADERQNLAPVEMIEFLEHTAMLIGEAVHRFDIEAKLRESEEQYRLLVELSPDGIGVEQDGKIIFANTMAATLLGYHSADELIGRDILDFVHPDFQKRVHKQLDYLRKKQIPLPAREEKFIRADGTVMDVEVAASPLNYQKKSAAQIVFRDITERLRQQQAIRENQRALRTLAAQLQLAEERQRRRIAQDLHDSVGQLLAFSSMELANLRKTSPPPLLQSLKTVSVHLDEAVKQTRSLSFDLSPSILYDLGFEVAVEDLVERFSKERNIRCSFENCRLSKPLSEDVKILLYRSIRELLINAAKHAHAGIIRVSLLRSSSDLYVIVEDDGRGFDVSILQSNSRKSTGFGLFSIRERLNHIGGSLKIESTNDKGTKAVLVVPLDLEKEENQ